MSDEKEKLGFSGLSSLASDIEEVAAGTPRPKDQSERSATPASEFSNAKRVWLAVVEFFLDVVKFFLYMFFVPFVLVVFGALISLFESIGWFVGLVMFGALIWLFKDIFKDR